MRLSVIFPKLQVFAAILLSGLLVMSATGVSGAFPVRTHQPSAVSDVYFVYKPWYNTKDYECWDANGTSTIWQGTPYLGGYDTVINAGVVRQGTIVYFNGTGASSSTSVTVQGPKSFSGTRAAITGWNPAYVSGEQWKVTVPASADVGDYKIYMDSAYATLYVVFNIMKWKGDFTAGEWRTWGYTETSRVEEYTWLGDYPPGVFGTGRPYSQRVTEFACSILGPGVRRETDAAAAICMMAQKRILYGTTGMNEKDFNTENILNGDMTNPGSPLPVSDARLAASDPAAALSPSLVIIASCSHYTTLTFGMMKSLGFAARCIFDSSGTWGWFYHHWLEVYLPDAAQTVNGTFDGWLTVDNTRQFHSGGVDAQDNGSPGFDTQQDYSFASYAFTTDKRPGDNGGGHMYTFRYSGTGPEEDSASWIPDDTLGQYNQVDIATAQERLPTLGNCDVFRSYLSEGDRDFFRVSTGGGSSVTLTITKGAQYAQLYAKKNSTVGMSPMNSRDKTHYGFDNWGDDSVTVPVPGTSCLYVMVDNAQGAKFSDDYTDGEIRRIEVSVSVAGAPVPVPPGPPMHLLAAGVADAIHLTWGMPVTVGGAPLSGFKVFRGTSSGGEGAAPVATVAAANTSYTDFPPASGKYFYIVKAANSAGDSLPSNEASANATVVAVVPEFLGVIVFVVSGASCIIAAIAILSKKRLR
jgi:hypothetical protein